MFTGKLLKSILSAILIAFAAISLFPDPVIPQGEFENEYASVKWQTQVSQQRLEPGEKFYMTLDLTSRVKKIPVDYQNLVGLANTVLLTVTVYYEVIARDGSEEMVLASDEISETLPKIERDARIEFLNERLPSDGYLGFPADADHGVYTLYLKLTRVEASALSIIEDVTELMRNFLPSKAFGRGIEMTDVELAREEREEVTPEPTYVAPEIPGNMSPTPGAPNINLAPTLKSSRFSDPDPGDSHAASQWQIRERNGDYSNPVFDSGRDIENLTDIAITSRVLDYSTTYYWRVRHQDDHGMWSNWSEETSFTTRPPLVAEALSSIEGKYRIVWGFEAKSQCWKLYDPNLPPYINIPRAHILKSLKAGKGYWINVYEDCTLTYGENDYHLTKGWNVIGWPGPSPNGVGEVEMDEALRSIQGKYIELWNFDEPAKEWKPLYMNGEQVNGVSILKSGESYWLKVSKNCTLSYGIHTYPVYKGWNLIGWLG